MPHTNETAYALEFLAHATPTEIDEAMKALSVSGRYVGFYEPLYNLRHAIESAGQLMAVNVTERERSLIELAKEQPMRQHYVLMDALRVYADSVHIEHMTGTQCIMPTEDLTESCYEDTIEALPTTLTVENYPAARLTFDNLFKQRNSQ